MSVTDSTDYTSDTLSVKVEPSADKLGMNAGAESEMTVTSDDLNDQKKSIQTEPVDADPRLDLHNVSTEIEQEMQPDLVAGDSIVVNPKPYFVLNIEQFYGDPGMKAGRYIQNVIHCCCLEGFVEPGDLIRYFMMFLRADADKWLYNMEKYEAEKLKTQPSLGSCKQTTSSAKDVKVLVWQQIILWRKLPGAAIKRSSCRNGSLGTRDPESARMGTILYHGAAIVKGKNDPL